MKPMLSILIFCFLCSNATATDPLAEVLVGRKKRETKKVLRATHEVLEIAQIQIQLGEKYDGTLTKACLHQAYAYYLLRKKHFKQAQIYSFYSRLIAFEAIKSNGGDPPVEFEVSKPELEALEMIAKPYNEVLPVKFKQENINDHYLAFKNPKRVKVIPKQEKNEGKL